MALSRTVGRVLMLVAAACGDDDDADSEIEALEEQVEELTEDLEEADAEIEQLTADNEELTAQNSVINAENRLQASLDDLKFLLGLPVDAADYREAGVPMLPVVVGGPRAARIIAAHTLALVALSLVPVAFGLGPVYLVCALCGGAMFVRASLALVRQPDTAHAM